MKPFAGDVIQVPSMLLESGSGEHFILSVVGDGQSGEGVLDGDFLVVMRCEQARSGDTVVALIGEEQTVKRLLLVGAGEARLESVCSAVPVICVPLKQVTVIGVVVGLLRKVARGEVAP